MTAAAAPARRRCAIYTRKSTSAGLEKDFNSLDAQRGACEAFIRSQPGWELNPEAYDDGGFTGANIDRPAFTRLLADVDAGKIDIVVVYKVDRLSRSLLDFAKLMDRFTKAKAAFVSVTQNFSTADAMGRLTLNVLMSFAEFEREMIAERTRDKIAASRKRGKWTGGRIPLGFVVREGKLTIDEHEALTVREIFATYLEHRSIVRIIATLKERGWATKLYESRDGKIRPRRAWTKDAVLRVLRNPLHAGLVQSGGVLFPGEHDAIVAPEDFRRVQELLGRPRCGLPPRALVPGYLLRGRLYCGACSTLMSPASTRRGNREYRYYRCLKRDKEGSAGCTGGPMPAKGIEDFVIERLRHTLANGGLVSEVVGAMRERVTKTTAAHTSEKQLLVEKIAQASSRVRNLTAQAEEGTVIGHGRTVLHERLEERGAELMALQERLDRIERELAQFEDARVEADWLEQTLAEFDAVWEVLTPENQTRLVRAVVDRVVVDEATGSVKMYVADLACAEVQGLAESA
jgi:DNA invertase Pin-like site-specific DNA recombinase